MLKMDRNSMYVEPQVRILISWSIVLVVVTSGRCHVHCMSTDYSLFLRDFISVACKCNRSYIWSTLSCLCDQCFLTASRVYVCV